MTKSILLLSCAAGALTLSLGAGGAFAATATAAAADSSQSTTTVTDIVVVAERREQSLQKVPVAVSVFTAAKRDLIGINSVQDVTNFAPGFVYDPGNVHAYIRGIGRQSINVTDTARIAAYEDEFYVYSPYQLDKSSLFLTQEQIERGPQNVGGRNADGGSIDMISVRPTDEPYAEARASVANFGSYELQGAVSGQVVPGLDVRLAAYDNQQTQGFYKNVTGGPSEGNEINEYYVEGQIDAKPNDNTEFWLRGFFAGWNNRGDAGARNGYVSGSWDETSLTDANGYPGAGLFVNPNYGYAGLPGAAGAAARAAAAAAAATPGLPQTGQLLPIVGDTTLLVPGILNNPSALNSNNFAAVQPRTDTLKGYDDVNYIFTYHFPTVDFRYIGGFQGYNYDLNFSEPDTDVTGYTLPGSTVPCAALAGLSAFLATLNCPTAAGFIGASLPAASNLVINPLAHLEYIEDDWWTSHEFSFQSTDNGPLQWIGGLYYFFQHYSNPITLAAPGQANLSNDLYTALPTPFSANFGTLAAPNPNRYLFVQNYQISQSSIAAYGQVAWKISDDFKVTGNMRYTEDYKSGTEEARYNVFSNALIDGFAPFYGAAVPALDDTVGTPAAPGLTCPTGINTTATSCFAGKLAPGVTSIGTVNPNNGEIVRGLGGASGALTGGAGAEWTPTPDIFVYARYNRGYEELTFNAGYVSAFPEVQPEDINSYELGYKQAFGHAATIDIAAFYYDYDNMQLPISVANGGVTQSEFINVPKAVSTGIEFEGNWSPITDLLLTFTYSYDYTAIETGCTGTVAGGKLTPATNSLCVVDTNDPDAVAARANPFPGQTIGATRDQSVKGNPLPQAPLNKVAFNAAYTWHFEPGSLTLSGSYVWRDVQDGTIFNRFYDNAPSWDDFDVRALWKGPNDKYEIIAYVKNIFNTLQYETGSQGAGLLGNATSVTNAAAGLDYEGVFTLAPPRTYGLEVRYKFF